VIHLAAKVILKEKEEERVEDSGKTWRAAKDEMRGKHPVARMIRKNRVIR
jgi:hypothetical protein